MSTLVTKVEAANRRIEALNRLAEAAKQRADQLVAERVATRARIVATRARIVAIRADIAAGRAVAAVNSVFVFGEKVDYLYNGQSASVSGSKGSHSDSGARTTTPATVEKVEELDFEALLQDEKFNCWPSPDAARSFAALLRERLRGRTAMIDIFDRIKANVAGGKLSDRLEKDHTRAFCLPLLHAVVDLARAPGDWEQLPAEFTFCTDKLDNRYDSDTCLSDGIREPDGVLCAGADTLDWNVICNAVVSIELNRKIDRAGAFDIALGELARDCNAARRRNVLLAIDTPVLVGIVGDGLNWRFSLLHMHMKRETSVDPVHECAVNHADGGIVAASVSAKAYTLDFDALMRDGEIPDNVVLFCQVLLGALSLGAKQLRVNTFARSIRESVGTLPDALCEFSVGDIATFRVTAYVRWSNRHTVVEADVLWHARGASTASTTAPTTDAAAPSESRSRRRRRKRTKRHSKAADGDGNESGGRGARDAVASTAGTLMAVSASAASSSTRRRRHRRHEHTATPAMSSSHHRQSATSSASSRAPHRHHRREGASSSTQKRERVVLKLRGMRKDSIVKEREARKLLTDDSGELIDGIAPIFPFPIDNMTFIVMPYCGVDLQNTDLTDDRMRTAVERAFGAFEATLHAIHAKKRVVFDLWPRNILVETLVDTEDKLEVKLWLVDLESMLGEDEPRGDARQLRVAGREPTIAKAEDDLKRWALIKKFVEGKGLIAFGANASTTN